jgi:protein TonB
MKWHQFYSINFLVGLASSLALINIFINYQSIMTIYPPYEMADVEDFTPYIPTSAHNEKKVLPVSVKKAMVHDAIFQDVEFIEDDLRNEERAINSGDEEPTFDYSPVTMAVKKPPLIIPIENDGEDEDILVMAERMPLFPGCDADTTEEERRRCTQQLLLSYLYRQIKYPVVAKDNEIEGVVVVEFVIDKEGQVGGIKVLRGIGGGCEKEVVRVVKNLPEWIPGKQNGRPVAVLYRIPVKFELQR